MKILIRLLLVALLVTVVGLIGSVFLVLQDQPTLPNPGEVTLDDVRRARTFLANSDPRNLAPGETAAMTFSESDLELLLNYGLSRLHGGAVAVQLDEDYATAVLSARLPDNPLGSYANVHVEMSRLGDALVVERLRVGTLPVPRLLANFLSQTLHRQLQRLPEYAAALDAVNGFSIAPDRVNVVYQWQPELMDQLSSRGRDLLVPRQEQDRLLAHARNLAEFTNSGNLRGAPSITAILEPMFSFAAARGDEPAEENRAALLVAGMYSLGINVPKALGMPADTVQPPGRHRLTLSGRRDFAQHFLVSAALTAGADSALADTIGLLKELDDSQGGSGFSFTDLGADRSGVRFAELAIRDQDTARALQRLLTSAPSEALFMAEFRDLPESLSEADFLARFGGVGAPAYNAVIADIEQRIAATPLVRELTGPGNPAQESAL